MRVVVNLLLVLSFLTCSSYANEFYKVNLSIQVLDRNSGRTLTIVPNDNYSFKIVDEGSNFYRLEIYDQAGNVVAGRFITSKSNVNAAFVGASLIESFEETVSTVQGTGDCPACGSAENYTENDLGSDPRYQYALKNYDAPREGCIPVEDVDLEEARDLLASQNLTTENATNLEIRTVGAAVKRVQELNGGPLRSGMGPGDRPFPFRFVDANGSQQYGSYIKIGRNTARKGRHHHGHSVAQHVHEWAHLIGNQGAYSQFRRYMDSSGYGQNDYCQVSNYAMSKANEQFAEVLTAFVTEPRILLNNTRTPAACRKVFEFFTQWFDDGEEVASCL